MSSSSSQIMSCIEEDFSVKERMLKRASLSLAGGWLTETDGEIKTGGARSGPRGCLVFLCVIRTGIGQCEGIKWDDGLDGLSQDDNICLNNVLTLDGVIG